MSKGDSGGRTLGLTGDDREQLQRILQDNRTSHVTEDMCKEARRRSHGGETYAEIAEDLGGPGEGAVGYHVLGKCDHEHGVEPGEPREQSDVGEDLCAEIREAFHDRDGAAVRVIREFADEAGAHADTVKYHAYGSCDHSHGVEAADRPGGE